MKEERVRRTSEFREDMKREKRLARREQELTWENFKKLPEPDRNNKYKIIFIVLVIILLIGIIGKIDEQIQYYRYERALEDIYRYKQDDAEPQSPVIEVNTGYTDKKIVLQNCPVAAGALGASKISGAKEEKS